MYKSIKHIVPEYFVLFYSNITQNKKISSFFLSNKESRISIGLYFVKVVQKCWPKTKCQLIN